jgi:hypothetical protein
MQVLIICDRFRKMPRRASSVSEIEQVVRVHGLLAEIGVCPPPLLQVLTVHGRSFLGRLMQDLTGSTRTRDGWSCFGSITLETERRKIEIDYLDVVTVERAGLKPRTKSGTKRARRTRK